MNTNPENRESLPRDCSPARALVDPRFVLFRSATVTIGSFRCDPHHPAFRDSGPIRNAVVVFPRTSVWIRHEGERAFVADPNVVTIYNRAQRYERRLLSPEGDHCDWFALTDHAAREVAATWEPRAADEPARPFRQPRAPSTTRLYARQRALLRRASAGHASDLEVEEETLAIVSEVLRAAATVPVTRTSSVATAARRRELAECARALLARTAFENHAVAELSATLGTSPFHLCRVFRAETGQTLHAYRVGLRVRAAMDRLASPVRGGRTSLSAVAHAVGFASHAHFVRICRRELGLTPAALRDRLG